MTAGAENSPSVLSCIDKMIKEGCDCGSEVGTVHRGQGGEGSVPPEGTEEVWQKKELWERFLQVMLVRVPYLFYDRG